MATMYDTDREMPLAKREDEVKRAYRRYYAADGTDDRYGADRAYLWQDAARTAELFGIGDARRDELAKAARRDIDAELYGVAAEAETRLRCAESGVAYDPSPIVLDYDEIPF